MTGSTNYPTTLNPIFAKEIEPYFRPVYMKGKTWQQDTLSYTLHTPTYYLSQVDAPQRTTPWAALFACTVSNLNLISGLQPLDVLGYSTETCVKVSKDI